MTCITPYELLELTNTINNSENTIQKINGFIEEFENNPKKYIVKLKNEIEEFSYDRQRCSQCGSKLNVYSHEESRGEYHGTDCTEETLTFECPNKCICLE